MIADNFTKVERDNDFHKDSYFEVTFSDGSVRSEIDTNWSEMSEGGNKVVGYRSGTKAVRVATVSVKSIKITHGALSTEIEIPEGCEVYQAVKADTAYIVGGSTHTSTLGRSVGLVKDGRVIEERFLDAQANMVLGFKE